VDSRESGRANVATIRESARDIPVRETVDVLVAGGGLGGVSAAVAAARAGASTLLVERNGFPGGVATAGLCCSVFNCFYKPCHELVVKGNALEFVDALAQAGGSGAGWHDHKGHIIFDLERAKVELIDLLESAGVHCLFDTLVAQAVKDGEAVSGVIIESKSGREAIRAQVVVDATGDADVAYLAGAPVHSLGEGVRARHSYNFGVGNVDVDRFVQYFCDHPDQYPAYMDVDWTFEQAHQHYRQTGTFLFPHGGGIQLDLIQRGVKSGEYRTSYGLYDGVDALQMHAIRELSVVHMVTGMTDIDDLDVNKITQAMTDGKRMAFCVTDYFRKHVPGFERAYVAATADDLGMRATRWIDGDFTFETEMRERATRFADAIGRGVVQRNYVRHPGPGAWGVQSLTDETFDIPYRCLLPRRIDGLLMGSGRSVSAANPLLLRVMAHTMVVGQGAGVGAALSCRQGVPPREVDVAALQRELRRQGVDLG